GVRLLRFERKTETVAGHVGHVLDLGHLIVVGEYDCVFAFGQFAYFVHQRRSLSLDSLRLNRGGCRRSSELERLRAHFVSTFAPRSGLTLPVPAGKTLQNSFFMRLTMAALLLSP